MQPLEVWCVKALLRIIALPVYDGLTPNVWKLGIVGLPLCSTSSPRFPRQQPRPRVHRRPASACAPGSALAIFCGASVEGALVGHRELVGDVSRAHEGEQPSPAEEAREHHRCRSESMPFGWQLTKMLLGRLAMRDAEDVSDEEVDKADAAYADVAQGLQALTGCGHQKRTPPAGRGILMCLSALGQCRRRAQLRAKRRKERARTWWWHHALSATPWSIAKHSYAAAIAMAEAWYATLDRRTWSTPGT